MPLPRPSRGFIVLVSGPSGVGKGTIVNALLKDPDLRLKLSISATTRRPRSNEVDGVHYRFKTREQFEAMIAAGELLEHAQYVGNYYGTPLRDAERVMAAGDNLLLEIECQGAMQVMARFPEVVSIFVMPPSLEELRRRLSNRGSESAEAMTTRIRTADEEIAQRQSFRFSVVNDDLSRAVEEIRRIVLDEQHARGQKR